jgi:hypothetical protein
MATGERNNCWDTFVSEKLQCGYLVSGPKSEHGIAASKKEVISTTDHLVSTNQAVRTWNIQLKFNYPPPAYLAVSINRHSGTLHLEGARGRRHALLN